MGIEDKWDVTSVVDGKILYWSSDCWPLKDSAPLCCYFTGVDILLLIAFLTHFSNFEIDESRLMLSPCCLCVHVSPLSTSECLNRSVYNLVCI
jgi:hypothetical protein